MQTALASPEVKTFSDLCVRLSKLPIDDESRKEYADVSKRSGDFMPLDRYIAQTYQQAALYLIAKEKGVDMSLSAIRKRLSDSIIWKSMKPELDKVTRHYQLYTTPADNAGLLSPGDPIWFDVYTDDKGAIFGWAHTDAPQHFTTIIVNGMQKTVGDCTISGAVVELMAYQDLIARKPMTRFAVRYKDGPLANREGTLSADKGLKIRNGMVFDVSIEKNGTAPKKRPEGGCE
ncbi:MAG TPA: hypothetical protein VHX63_00010 [Acidobacteriaceae bacterium]|nr:hypothetical protein [Acidobacteriaceae bacterium]